MLYPDINSQKRTQQNTTRYRTALYLRLSREDGDKTESDSIANQRTLLEAYAIDHPELCIVDEFVDDGYSGSNFERPAFQRLFQELEQGTINCILVKDLSRFGRNYIEVGRYLERIFPVMRVRLIAVTDSYDSQSAWKTSDSIMVPMRNLLNDAYCRDISVKIKSQLAVKRKRGDFVGSFATYGYQKDPSNHTKLIVDELAAENVQSIFRWKISGMNNQGIANRLNAKKVSSPAARKLQSGAKLSLHFRKSDEPPWSAKAVDRILHNEVYIGKLVQGKTRRLDYRSKKKMNVPMRDWVIVDNTHEAIIPAEQFELVQRILETETRRPNDAETVALFAGFLYCGDCGSRLVRRSASYKGKRYIYYQCSGSKQNKGSCTSHNLRDAAIVTPQEFEQAQKVIMLQHGKHQAGNYTKHQYPLKGKVYCGYCQKLMKYRVLKKLGPSFNCRFSATAVDSPCKRIPISEKLLEEIVRNALTAQIKQAEHILEILHERERKALVYFSALERQEEKLSVEKAEIVKQRVALYEQYADGNMSKEEFIRQRDAYRVQEDDKMEQIQRLRTEKDQILLPVKKDTDHLQTVMSTVEEAGDVMHLSQNVVEAFIDRIEVFNDERVKIRFTFEDALNSCEEK